MKTRIWRSIFAVGVGVVLLSSKAVEAAGETPVPRVVHYDGYLEDGSGPVDGTVNAVFLLHNTPSGASTSPAPYRYPKTGNMALVVTQGRFVVDIGRTGVAGITADPLPAWVFEQADQVYLEVVINGYTLTGRQKIQSVPYSVRASEAVTFTVKDQLTAGVASVSGNVGVGGNLTVSGTASVETSISVPNISLSDGGSSNVPNRCAITGVSVSADANVSATCAADKFAISGGCKTSSTAALMSSAPNSSYAYMNFPGGGGYWYWTKPTAWNCAYSAAGAHTAYVTCCKW